MTSRSPEKIKPARIFILSDQPLSVTQLERLIPTPKEFLYTTGPFVRTNALNANVFTVSFEQVVSAEDVLAWHKSHEEQFQAIREGVARPWARLEGEYDFPPYIPIPSWAALRVAAQGLGAAAQADLLLDNPEAAIADITLIHQLRRLLEGPPNGAPETLVAAMVNVAVAGLYVGQVEDGLQRHAWTDDQLAALDQQLGEKEVLKFFSRALDFERIATPATISQTNRMVVAKLFLSGLTGRKNTDYWSSQEPLALLRWMPQGWWDQNVARCEWISAATLEVMTASSHPMYPREIDSVINVAQTLSTNGFGPYHWFGPSQMVPDYTRAIQTCAKNQALISLCRIACALERYRLKHHVYPAALRDLSPEYLAEIPSDLIGGKKPAYELKAADAYDLTSAGWKENERWHWPDRN